MNKVSHERLDKIAKRISKYKYRTLPYTTPDDVYQTAYMGALKATRRADFKPDMQGADHWLYLYARKEVSGDEIPLNKSCSKVPDGVVDRLPSDGIVDVGEQSPVQTALGFQNCFDGMSQEEALEILEKRLIECGCSEVDKKTLLLRASTDMSIEEVATYLGVSYRDVCVGMKRVWRWARKDKELLRLYLEHTGKKYVPRKRRVQRGSDRAD